VVVGKPFQRAEHVLTLCVQRGEECVSFVVHVWDDEPPPEK
jgi:hypothetical protein